MRIVMMGTGTFAEPTFEALIAALPGEVVGLITQPDRDTGRRSGSSRMTGKGMANIATAAEIPVAQPANINTPEGLAELKAMKPDLLVVAAYGQILKPDVINAGPMGAINVHASLLPKYRGAAPVAHAILNGESTTGVTIIRISTGLDAGDMLAQVSLDILPGETAGELEARLAPLGAKSAVETVQKLKDGPISGIKQDPNLVTKAPKLMKEMGLIDWSQPADRVCCQIRAMQPWPTAYTFFHRPGKEPLRVMICSANEMDVRGEQVPGTATSDSMTPLGIVTGSKVVAIQDLQIAGKKKMTAAEFIRGYPITDGCRFGPESSK